MLIKHETQGRLPGGGEEAQQKNKTKMKTATKIVTLVSLAAVLAGSPMLAQSSTDGKTFKDKVVVEEPTKWYAASLSTGWDSLYMFLSLIHI